MNAPRNPALKLPPEAPKPAKKPEIPGTKKRPAVVVSSHGYNTNRPDIVIMAITSQVRTPLGFGEAMVGDWQGAGLVKTSVLKPVFTTIEQGLVLRVMGHLSATDIKTLREVLGDMIG